MAGVRRGEDTEEKTSLSKFPGRGREVQKKKKKAGNEKKNTGAQ